jgi:pimeloyl-ACP methyl ester carboxylesterase
LELHVHRFICEDVLAQGLTALLLHGFLDSGASWDDVAAPLARAGIAVYAPDLRGFGASDRVDRGGYYHFPDYVADVAQLITQIAPKRLLLVGHSMGGTVACLYAAARPDRVDRLVLLEGLGPPAMGSDAALYRLRQWLTDLDSRRDHKPMTREEAVRRLALNHPRVPHEILERRAEQLTVAAADGARIWAHDPLHRTTSPIPFNAAAFREMLRAIRCPTLFIGGGDDGFHPVDESERLAAIAGARRVDLPGAGHMMHWTEAQTVAKAILEFAGG